MTIGAIVLTAILAFAIPVRPNRDETLVRVAPSGQSVCVMQMEDLPRPQHAVGCTGSLDRSGLHMPRHEGQAPA